MGNVVILNGDTFYNCYQLNNAKSILDTIQLQDYLFTNI